MDQRLFRYWGKARSDNEDGPQWHLLVYHSLDVAAVADCWLQKDRALRDLLVRAANLDFEPTVKGFEHRVTESDILQNGLLE